MAIINACGAETGSLLELDTYTGTVAMSGTQKHTGAYAVRCYPTTTGTGYFTLRSYGTTGVAADFNAATSYITFWLYIVTGGNWEIIAEVDDASANYKFYLALTSLRKLDFYNAADSKVGTGSTVLSVNTWYRIDIKCGTSATVGAYEVRINGVSEYSGTTNLGANNGAIVWLGKLIDASSSTVDWYFDDIVISDSAYAGEFDAVQVMQLDGNGTYTAGTAYPSGALWDTAEEIPYSNANYAVTQGTSGCSMSFNMESADAAGVYASAIGLVKPVLMVVRDGSSNGAVRTLVRSGSTDAASGADYTTTTTEACLQYVYLVDPADSAAWTLADLDALQVGITDKSTNKSRLLGECAIVLFTRGTNGTLSKTLAALTIAGTGKLAIAGTLSKTLAALTLVGTGKLAIAGTLSKTLAALTLVGVGKLAIAGTLSKTLAAITVSSTGVLESTEIIGVLTKTLAAMTVSSTGTLPIYGTLTKTLAAMTVSSTSKLDIVGTLTKPLAAFTISGTGTVAIQGTLAKTLVAITVSSTGTLAISGTLAKTLTAVTLSSTGTLPIVGSLSKTMAAMTLTAVGASGHFGETNVTLAKMTLTGAGVLPITGVMSKTLQALTLGSTGALAIQGALSKSLAALTINSSGILLITGQSGLTLQKMTLVSTGMAGGITGQANITLTVLTIVAIGTLPIKANAGITMRAMTVAGVGGALFYRKIYDTAEIIQALGDTAEIVQAKMDTAQINQSINEEIEL